MQKERVDVLTTLVRIYEAQYRVGTTWCEAVIGAETDLVNAQLDAADKPEERVALLTEGLKREREFLDIVEKSARATIVTHTDVEWARSICLYAEIRLSIAEKDKADRIKG